ncbi:sulfur carrier protein ThiS [Shewanella sp. Isolate13]|uniref:sulfur carrier protein ThiS n=1 Tax=Shewanella sp. Isolate13 TaxID=2908531 RepID=UPI001EFC4124|nr:sulfur carrier protein ThiS [Shewanella sp. Isolate13]MCG9731800.1 sulfur carrier protein ThiS [Shewanella sp. Isolate13]
MYKGNDSISIIVNDEVKQVAVNATLQSVIEGYCEIRGVDMSAIAAALNGDVITRSRWQSQVCQADDKLELFSVVAGG